jgi:hypothetical protein
VLLAVFTSVLVWAAIGNSFGNFEFAHVQLTPYPGPNLSSSPAAIHRHNREGFLRLIGRFPIGSDRLSGSKYRVTTLGQVQIQSAAISPPLQSPSARGVPSVAAPFKCEGDWTATYPLQVNINFLFKCFVIKY